MVWSGVALLWYCLGWPCSSVVWRGPALVWSCVALLWFGLVWPCSGVVWCGPALVGYGVALIWCGMVWPCSGVVPLTLFLPDRIPDLEGFRRELPVLDIPEYTDS